MPSLLPRRPAVLAYHGVFQPDPITDPNRLLVSPEHLASHVAFLQRRGYRFVTASHLTSGPAAAGTAVLTFDDGFRHWIDQLLPVLTSFAIPATVYVCPGLWGRQHADVSGPAGLLVSLSDVRAMHDAAVEIGSHAMTHRDLRLLDDHELRRELVDSKAAIEEITQEPCRTLAYPFGLFDDRVLAAAVAAGYEGALGWQPGPWRRYAVPRLPAPCRHDAGRLALKLLGVRRWWAQ
jgi:peptidoglycan/xylan/chitin deacetylase (PgdA/CDA1 family)